MNGEYEKLQFWIATPVMDALRLMATALRNIRNRTEELLDIADWLQAFLDNTPEDVKSIYIAARAELEAGLVYDLAQVR